MTLARRVAAFHAGYYVLTGAWSLIDRRSFERVTGPKHDYWLVRTVGALAIANGAVLGLAVARGRRREGAALALCSGLAFVASDVQAMRASSRVYLGDVAVHGLLLPAWLRCWNDE